MTSRRKPKPVDSSVSGFTFKLYMVFIVSFFLHMADRIPGISVIRPDLLMIITIVFLLFIQQDKLKGRMNDACSRALKLFLAYFVLSIPFVEWPGSVIQNLDLFVKSLIFYFFTVLIVDTDKRLKTLILVFVSTQIFRVMEPLYLNITTGYLSSATSMGGGVMVGRLGGAPHDIINGNGLALVIASIFPFIHFIWGADKWKWKLSYYALIPPLLYALVLTLSRSGFIALGVVVWQIFMKSNSRFLISVIIILIAMGSWFNMSDVQKSRYLSLSLTSHSEKTSGFDGSAKGRVNAWFRELDTFLYRPVVGHGIGTSAEAAAHTRGKNVLSHNLYTEVLIELGFIGFVFYMLYLKSIYNSLNGNVRTLKKMLNDNTEPDEVLLYYKRLNLALYASFWMYLIFSFAQYGVREYNWYFLGGMTSLLNINLQRHLDKLKKSAEAEVEAEKIDSP